MITGDDSWNAVNVALECHKRPNAFDVKRELFPHGMLNVIKIAGGDDTTLQNCAEATGFEPASLMEACRWYLIQMLYHKSKSELQLLGLNPGASLEDIRQHKRWLAKWLHPDRNANVWETKFFHKVERAGTSLMSVAKAVGTSLPTGLGTPTIRGEHRHKGKPQLVRRRQQPLKKNRKFKMIALYGSGAVAILMSTAWLFGSLNLQTFFENIGKAHF